MSDHEYVQYKEEGVFYEAPRDMMTMLACLVPPVLFTLSWLTGRASGLYKGRKGAENAARERQS